MWAFFSLAALLLLLHDHYLLGHLTFTKMNAQPIHEWIKKIIYPSNFLQVPKEDEQKLILFAAMLFNKIWWSRHQVIFNKKNPRSPWGHDTAFHINKSYFEHLKAWTEITSPISCKMDWNTSPIGWLKFNFNAAILHNKATAAAYCRFDTWELLYAC